MKSIFKDLIKKYFNKVSKKYYELISGTKEEPKYIHDQALTPEYSVDMTYSSISGKFTRVTADVVSFDSPVALKSRGSIKTAAGEIPKLGLKYVLNEKQMNSLHIMSKFPERLKELIRKIFEDTKACILGIKESVEEAFLIGLSSGVTIIKEENNVGTGIRINYNIPESNQFGASVKWSDPEAMPINDIRRIRKRARDNGRIVDTIWMDESTFYNMANNKQVREMWAFSLNFVGDKIPTLDDDQLIGYLKKKLKLNVMVIDRTFNKEKDGKITVTNGWTPNMVVFTNGIKVGSLVYGTLAEENFPNEGVSYAKPNDYILISKSGTTDPVSEKTAGQAIVIPVLQNVDSIFYLDTEEAVEDVQTEGDAVFAYKGSNYTLQSVVDAINLANPSLKATINQKDTTLQTKINKLSEDEVAVFEDNIVASV
ncbi:major capsid protein [Aquimarina macrocephali]|uniref:major capsid protein n=1 Tax=Aquimarina macrocephali TaxID=666563 RepID=UPI003F675BAF